jgi:hypothetical protein
MAVRQPESDASLRLDDLEVVEIELDEPAPRPPALRLFAGLPTPDEVPYARHGPDPTGLAGLWQAISNL